MSGRARRRAGWLFARTYPTLWRERYGEEIDALIDDDPPSLPGLASLVRGAAAAHLHPAATPRTRSGVLARMRLSVCGAFACWTLLSLAGVAFQKITEDPSFEGAASHHPLLALARDVIVAGALLGALTVAVGGLPLLWHAVARARALRERRLWLLLALPAGAVAAFVTFTLLLLALAPGRGGGFPVAYVMLVLVPWTLAATACAFVCALTPRAVLARTGAPPTALRHASRSGAPLAVAIVLVVLGVIVYAVALGVDAPALSGQTTGPFGVSTLATLAIDCVGAALVGGLGLTASWRALRAARELGSVVRSGG